MKYVIIIIVILFSIGYYLIIFDSESNNVVETNTATINFDSTKTTLNKTTETNNIEQKIIESDFKEELNKNKVANNEKKEMNIKKSISTTKNIEKNIAISTIPDSKDIITPKSLVKDILLFRENNNNKYFFHEKLADLEDNLLSKLEDMPDEDIYTTFNNILNSDKTTLEEKKYLVDLLEVLDKEVSKELLIDLYKNSDNEELKEKISQVNAPEIDILKAVEAQENDNADIYKKSVAQLNNREDTRVIQGFMTYAKNSNLDSIDNLNKVISQWSSKGLSEESIERLQDYITKSDTKPTQRAVAVSILAHVNKKDKEERDKILKKALEHEENSDVISAIESVIANN